MTEQQERELLKSFIEYYEATVDYMSCEPSFIIDSYIKDKKL